MRGDLRTTLLKKEMSRKEFLQFLGSALIILFGLPNFIRLLQRTARGSNGATSNARHGFGSSKFGV